MCVEMVSVVTVRGWDGDEEKHCCAAVVMDISQHILSASPARPATVLLSGVSSHLESGAGLVLGGTEILISMIIINSEMSIPHVARRGAAHMCVRKGLLCR